MVKWRASDNPQDWFAIIGGSSLPDGCNRVLITRAKAFEEYLLGTFPVFMVYPNGIMLKVTCIDQLYEHEGDFAMPDLNLV